MAYVINEQQSRVGAALAAMGNWLADVGRTISIASSAEDRLRRIERLNAKSDEELAELGVKRDEITAYVFRDIFYI